MKKLILSTLSVAALLYTSGLVYASDYGKKEDHDKKGHSTKCTDAPKEQWLSEEAMKQKISEMGYKDIQAFKQTKGNCYEIYGHNQEGKKAEVYFNPVDGTVVKEKIKK